MGITNDEYNKNPTDSARLFSKRKVLNHAKDMQLVRYIQDKKRYKKRLKDTLSTLSCQTSNIKRYCMWLYKRAEYEQESAIVSSLLFNS